MLLLPACYCLPAAATPLLRCWCHVPHASQLYAAGGVRSLWTGLSTTLVRAFPANAAHWLAWELTMYGLRDGE